MSAGDRSGLPAADSKYESIFYHHPHQHREVHALERYLNEFSYRFNRRKDDGAFMETARRLAGFKPLPFNVLISERP